MIAVRYRYGLPEPTFRTAAFAGSTEYCAATYARIQSTDRFADTDRQVGNRLRRRTDYCFSSGPIFIDLSAKFDGLPLRWRQAAHRTHCDTQVSLKCESECVPILG